MRPSRWGSLVVVAGLLYAALVAIPTPVAAAAPRHASGGELVAVGQDESIVLSVNAETAADLVGVEILIPDGFTPDPSRPPDAKGGGVGGVFLPWQAQFSASGRQLQAAGPGIADGGLALVTFSGTASRLGTLSFVTVTRAADGTSVRWDGAPSAAHPAAVVYVVRSLTDPLPAPGLATGAPSSSRPPLWAAGAAGVAGLALLGAVVAGRRHRRPAGPSGTRNS